jgi:GNAT superfamily N-acetyltransferase
MSTSSRLDVRVAEIEVPRSLNGPAGAEFVDATTVANTSAIVAYGDHFVLSPREQHYFATDPGSPTRVFVARVQDSIVGRATCSMLPADSSTAWLTVDVLPEQRQRGIGSDLLATAETAAAANGATKFVVEARVAEHDGPRLTARTGFGTVPMHAPNTLFLLKHGYTIEQVLRVSRVPLPVAAAKSLLDESLTHAGSDYALHGWLGTTPARWRDDMAALATLMSTDVPSGEIAPPKDTWTAKRVIEDDARRDALSGLRRLVAAVEHVPSGRLVGYSEFLVPAETARDAYQWFTVAVAEHRGKRLGTVLKTANLTQLAERFPTQRGIITANAEENRPMLEINERLGFRPVGYHSEWKRETPSE